MSYSQFSSNVNSQENFNPNPLAKLLGGIDNPLTKIFGAINHLLIHTIKDKEVRSFAAVRGITEVNEQENVKYEKQMINRNKIYDYQLRNLILKLCATDDVIKRMEIQTDIYNIIGDFKKDARELVKQIINFLFFKGSMDDKFYIKEIKYVNSNEGGPTPAENYLMGEKKNGNNEKKDDITIEKISIGNYYFDIDLYFPKLDKVIKKDPDTSLNKMFVVANNIDQKEQKLNMKSLNFIFNQLFPYYQKKFDSSTKEPMPFLWVPLTSEVSYKGILAKVTTNSYMISPAFYHKISDLKDFEEDDFLKFQNNSQEPILEDNLVYGLTHTGRFHDVDEDLSHGLRALNDLIKMESY